MKRIILIVTLFAGFACFGQTQVFKVEEYTSAQPFKNSSFYYMLPQTTLQLEVTVTKTREIQGCYSAYAEKLLGLSNIITGNKTNYKLKGVDITPLTLPDTTQMYLVELSAKQVKSQFLNQLYKNQGVSISQLPTSDFSVTSAKVPDFFKNYANLSYSEMDDAYLETQIINGVVTQVPANKTKVVSKTEAQQAQEAADFIAKIKKDRYDLLIGINEVPYTEGAISAMIEQLNMLEQNYLALFSGFTIVEEEKHIVMITPREINKTHAFSIDSEIGFSKEISLKEEQNYCILLTPQVTNAKHNQIVAAKYLLSPKAQKSQNAGYHIRKPQPALVSLVKNEKNVHSFGLYDFFQIGKIDVFPPNWDDFDILNHVILY